MSQRTQTVEVPSHEYLVQHGRKIFEPVVLPCGRVAPNRLFKAALYEHFAEQNGGPPHSGHIELYKRWAKGGWGIILSGNAQTDKYHLTIGRDLAIPENITDETLEPWKHLADAIHSANAPTLAPEKGLAPLAIWSIPRPSSASAECHQVWRNRRNGWVVLALVHPVPREMTKQDIARAQDAYVRGAELAARTGWDGVQLHGAHGYLISSFIMPKSNHRTDEYSADKDPLRFMREIAFAIRASPVIPDDFALGVKINSDDYARDGSQRGPERSLEHIREIGSWGIIDFIEVSGGDYETPEFVDTVANFKSPRQVVFESFAEQSMRILAESANSDASRRPPLVVVTGGLHTLPRMASVLAHNHTDLLGVGRLSVVCPDAPRELAASLERRARGEPDDFLMEDFPTQGSWLGHRPRSLLSLRALERAVSYVFLLACSFVPVRLPRIVGASAATNWYCFMLRYTMLGKEPDYSVGNLGATIRCFFQPTPYAPSAKKSRGWAVQLLVLAVGAAALGLGVVQRQGTPLPHSTL
ncbi:hypothetical protein BC628DRAFT_1406804 [Trametes gibbosa]|nr:hypothetical protein BC628DRAFT_1406804 [Trametes gibbosa]